MKHPIDSQYIELLLIIRLEKEGELNFIKKGHDIDPFLDSFCISLLEGIVFIQHKDVEFTGLLGLFRQKLFSKLCILSTFIRNNYCLMNGDPIMFDYIFHDYSEMIENNDVDYLIFDQVNQYALGLDDTEYKNYCIKDLIHIDDIERIFKNELKDDDSIDDIIFTKQTII